MNLNELQFPARAWRVFATAQVLTVDDLCKLSVFKLSRYRHCGRKTLCDIVLVLRDQGRFLAPNGELPEWAPHWVKQYDRYPVNGSVPHP